MISRIGLLCLFLISAVASHGTVFISEFVADNVAGLQDEDLVYADWIELQNNGTTAVNLEGWSLTDDAGDVNKWVFPAVTIGPGQFLVVFASGKDRRVVGANLHTNFSLASAGEYLALRNPAGSVASEFAPTFPPQFEDKSYGIGQNVQTTQLVPANAAVRAHVPASGTLGTTWTAVGFDDSAWTAGTQGVGFEGTVLGFAFRTYFANVGIGSIATANQVIATPAMQTQAFAETRGVVNYMDSGGGGHYSPESNPSWATGGAENYVVEATGILSIPTPGAWTFGVNSDDGFQLQIRAIGASAWITICNFDGGRGASDTVGTYTFSTAGDYELRVMIYEGNGGSAGEAWAKQGSVGAWDSGFRLIGDTANGGLAVRSVPIGGSNSGGLQSLIGTDIKAAMAGINATAYARIPFSVADVSQLQTLTLKAKYDDGFVAYVNGVEVARRNAPATPAWNSTATASHAAAQVTVYESIDASAALPVLVNGESNVLAVQLLNVAANDTDALMLAELAEYEITGSAFHFLNTPTPGNVNGTDYYAFVEKPVMSLPHGFYTAAFPLTLTTPTVGAQIRYTTDGSAPTPTTGMLYTAPLNITGTTVVRAIATAVGADPSGVTTQTYIFLDQVIVQPALPVGFPTQWGPVTGFYQMNTSAAITGGGSYSATVMKNALKAIPSVSIVTSMVNLFNPATGIYANSGGEGVAWERPASLEWIDPTGGGHEFQIDCGLRIQGGASRGAGNLKHAFRVLFKDQYGPTKLKFALFAGSPVEEFDTFDFHARFNDLFFNNGSAQYIRDMWCGDTQLAMGRLGAHHTFVHLYVNGAYWGLYDPGEKPDASFAAHYQGGDKSEYDAVNSNEFIDGDGTAWNAMFAIANGGLSSDTAYASIKQYLDVASFADYMMTHLYAGTSDWPWHNWTAARRRVAGAGYLFFCWDAEWSFSDPNANVTGVSDANTPGGLWQSLRQNAEFRQLVGDLAQKHCFNGGALTPAAAQARWMARATEIDQAIMPESARWGSATRTGNWLPEQNRLLTTYFPPRTATLIQQLRAISCFPANNAPTFSQYGGTVAAGYPLVITNPNAAGTVIFTINGTDPRLPGGAIAPGAQTYAAPLVLNASAVIRARVKDGATWSAITEATFFTNQNISSLIVSEIHYNPLPNGATSGDEYEFLELKNIGATTLDLGGLSFSSGITFTFTAGTTLAPNAFFVLARSATQFASRYPGVSVNGTYTGRFDNGGERLTLLNVGGTQVVDFDYDDEAPWPVTPDGPGFSLVPTNPATHTDPGDAAKWRASTAVGGSPGADDPASTIAPIVISEALTNSTLPLTDTIELHNPTAGPVTVTDWWLTDEAAIPKKYRLPATTIPAGGHVTFNETQFNPTPGVGTSFSLSSTGEQVYLYSGDGAGNLTGYAHGLTFQAADDGVSFGRYLNSVGAESFPSQTARTLGAANAGPVVGPLVINEIQYRPLAGSDEFLEIKNISGGAVNLWDAANPANTWKVGGVGFSFPTNTTIPAGGFALIVAIDPATFRAKYQIPVSVPIFATTGTLDNNGERLTLEKPAPSYVNTLGQTVVPFVIVDFVRYNNVTPWPVSAAGNGPSLQRTNSSLFADDPANWFADGLTPGAANGVNQPPSVALTSPANGSSFILPTVIGLAANASDPDGFIAKVEFYDGATLIGTVTTAPYTYAWSTATAGSHTITARAHDSTFGITTSAPAIIGVTGSGGGGNGTGWFAQYFDDANATSHLVGAPLGTRTDATINFLTVSGWASNFFPAAGNTTFSVRWSGQLLPPATGTYKFYTSSADGVRLYVNGQAVINNWIEHPFTTDIGTIALNAGQFYDIVVEYYQNIGVGYMILEYECTSAGIGRGPVPTNRVYPAGAPTIITHPGSVALTTNNAVGFSVLAAGVAPLSFQWQFNDADIDGATGSALTLQDPLPAQAGNYRVRVANGFGAVTSNNATLTIPDTDSDGLPDYWEYQFGLNPGVANNGDSDGDGFSDKAEFLAGTNPFSSASRLTLAVAKAVPAGNGFTLAFTAQSNRSYAIQYKDAMNAASWTTLQQISAAPGARPQEFTDPATGQPKRFYRIITPQQ